MCYSFFNSFSFYYFFSHSHISLACFTVLEKCFERPNPENSVYFCQRWGKKVNWNCFRTSSNVWSGMRNKMQTILHSHTHTLRRDRMKNTHFESAINAISVSTLHTLFCSLSLFLSFLLSLLTFIHSFIHPSIVFALREIDSRVTRVHMVAWWLLGYALALALALHLVLLLCQCTHTN